VNNLQNQIRKLKNPSMVYFCYDQETIPRSYLDDSERELQAYCAYAKDLLVALKGLVPAVRFGFGGFALCGAEGLAALEELLRFARKQEFYILLDVPELWSLRQAELAADALLRKKGKWEFDGLLVASYLGTDSLKPFADGIRDVDKDLFIVARTANKSASELQDLLSGSRLVWTAAADTAKRLGENMIGRSGYSRIGIMGPATSADTLTVMRGKYPTVFLLIDGFDYSGANARICAGAFDKLGHGAVACVGSYVLSAWKDTDLYDPNPIELAVLAAERMKKNLSRSITVL